MEKSSKSSSSTHTHDPDLTVLETQDHHATMAEGRMMNHTRAAEEEVGPEYKKQAEEGGGGGGKPKLEKFAYGCECLMIC